MTSSHLAVVMSFLFFMALFTEQAPQFVQSHEIKLFSEFFAILPLLNA
jgi:hypothetical protein